MAIATSSPSDAAWARAAARTASASESSSDTALLPIADALVTPVDADEDEDEHADQDLLGRLVGSMPDEQGGDEGEDQRSEDGAPVVAARAHERCPAHQHGGEAREQVGVADAGLAGAGEAGQQDAD